MGLDLDALRGYLARQAQATRLTLSSERLSGGAIQENYIIQAIIEDGPHQGEHEWVLRTDAASGVAVSRSREQEYRLLSAAFDAGLTVPRPMWLCTDPGVLGRVFYVMEKVAGTADGRRLVGSDRTAAQRRDIVASLGQELARLHTIDPRTAGLTFLQPPEHAPAAARIALYRAYLDTLDEPQPVLEWGLRWLEIHAPEHEEVVLCHCDFRTGNIMIDGNRVTGILDWEFADYSSPLEDLGWFCARCWRFGADQHEAGGIGSRDDFVTAYEQASGRSVDRNELGYWQIMAEVRWGIIALQQTGRHLSRAEPSLELALTGYMVPEMEMNLIHAIEQTEQIS